MTRSFGVWTSFGVNAPFETMGRTVASDDRSVPLLSIDTDVGQTGTASGKLKFNKAPR